jgi:hypothetical protein
MKVKKKKKKMLTLQQAVEADKVVRSRDYQIFWTDGGELSLTSWPLFNPQEVSFLLEAESVSGTIVRLEGLGKSKKKSNSLIGNGILSLPSCSISPLPTTSPRAPLLLRDNNLSSSHQSEDRC